MRFKQSVDLMGVIGADDLKYECMLLLLSSEEILGLGWVEREG